MSKQDDQRRTYRKWWVGKLCKARYQADFKKVVDVKTYGPPSFVYGCAELVFEDLTTAVIHSPAYRPRKQDVTVKENTDE